MKIDFLSADGALIIVVLIDKDNEWDASLEAQRLIDTKTVKDAVDFQIIRD